MCSTWHTPHKATILIFIPVHSVLCLVLSVHHPHKPKQVQKKKQTVK